MSPGLGQWFYSERVGIPGFMAKQKSCRHNKMNVNNTYNIYVAKRHVTILS